MKKLMTSAGNLTLDVAGSASITGSPSAKVKAPAGGAGVFFQQVPFTIAAGCSDGVCQSVSPFPGNVPASATKVKSGGQPAVLDGDNVTVSVPGFKLPAMTIPCTISAKVTANAGQSKALAT